MTGVEGETRRAPGVGVWSLEVGGDDVGQGQGPSEQPGCKTARTRPNNCHEGDGIRGPGRSRERPGGVARLDLRTKETRLDDQGMYCGIWSG